VGKATVKPRLQRSTANTPETPLKRKMPRKRAIIPEMPNLNVDKLPGKKSTSTKTAPKAKPKPKPAPKPKPKPTYGKCPKCDRRWESNEDKSFRKKMGQRKYAWIGCDYSKCNYWAHAFCVGVQILPKKKIESTTFYALHTDNSIHISTPKK